MTEDLKAFFARVTEDADLQKQLYVTHEVADVATIASALGFKITAAEVLQAQAGRVLTLPVEELEELTAGRRAKSGAQWGRAGKGYLERAGFWLVTVFSWTGQAKTDAEEVGAFLNRVKEDSQVKRKLFDAKTYNEVAEIAKKEGYPLSAIDLLRFQAKQLLELTQAEANEVAAGAGALVL